LEAWTTIRQSGVDELRLLHRPVRRLQVIAGTDFGLTQVEALEALHTPPDRECRLYYAPEDAAEGVFHPKLYLGTAGSDFIAVVGSSNLTGGGLTTNIELNVALTGASTSHSPGTWTASFGASGSRRASCP
jgi:HKD family nuclease